MRLAFCTSLLPTGNPDTGFEIANGCILEALRQAGCDVTLFGFLRQDETQAPSDGSVIMGRMVIENAVASQTQKLRWLLDSLTLDLPVIATKLATFGEARLRALLAQHGPFDGYIINSAPVAAAFPWLLQDNPAILVAHNVEHASARENAATAGWLTGLLYRREARLLHRSELQALGDARFIWCLSEEDRQGFGVDIEAKSAVMPLLVPITSVPVQSETTYDVGLIGTWTWQPNLVGLQWFLDAVMPYLPHDISVAVAGRLPAGVKARHGQVNLLGRVPDASIFLNSVRTVALTSRSGTGIQLKTIETFQMGKPTVATPSSIRGLSQLPRNCLVADDAKGFAAALTKLVRDVASGRTQPVDGQAFTDDQKRGMKEAIRCGLDALGQG